MEITLNISLSIQCLQAAVRQAGRCRLAARKENAGRNRHRAHHHRRRNGSEGRPRKSAEGEALYTTLYTVNCVHCPNAIIWGHKLSFLISNIIYTRNKIQYNHVVINNSFKNPADWPPTGRTVRKGLVKARNHYPNFPHAYLSPLSIDQLAKPRSGRPC
jgi:hypothetical protein